ncbi:DNA repair protein RecO [Siccirubricoccus deserti]|uniref:DNA repair protein RecO n=1 Tax=Siccirubricoccus deserti TaxID=2013562 RepID=A0A9X0QYS9_9PROT|nr:DNA repair protein RecO [Siccirubricoccus deserti]MBC4015393.1 DNA repair protein RecO [Siccirubricoccus deserti]GGC41284.1 DNA repair protein RecO [Siccirubricoccus deserti]
MEWQAPAVVLEARPHGEGGAVVSVLTEAQGRHAGLARGGASRAQAPLWQPGNLVEARWVARLPDQLGALSGELLHPAAALAMEDPLALSLLAAACAVAEAALPEREAHPRCFHGLVALITRLPAGAAALLPEYVRWEAELLAELGYGLDLARCAVTGSSEDLVWVSPRSGRAVGAEAGAPWAGRLLPLPGFLLGQGPASGPVEWLDGLRLTGHFLARDALGHRPRGLPAARVMLQDRIAALAAPAAAQPPPGDGPLDSGSA